MKFYEIKKYLAIIILIFIHLIITSCSSPKNCSKENDNLQAIVNTNWDELSPFFLNENFYFIRQKNEKDRNPIFWEYDFQYHKLSKSHLFDIKNLKNPSNYSFYQFGDTVQVFFAASVVENKILNRNIFEGKMMNSEIIEIAPIEEINTHNFEAYPAISKDGKLLVFVSDRQSSLGGTDLYLSIKNNDGKWSQPINFGDKINTPANEISPYIDEQDNLYFSSNGYDKRNDFNIMKSNYVGDYQWMLAKSLPVQINSDSSEINPFILNNQIYYSSNREGGCGGFDIYFDKLCGNVVLLGIVFDKQNKLPLNGVVRIYDNSTKLIKEINIEDNGNFSTELLPNSQYFIEYYNSCVPLYTPRKLIQTPCNEESITQLNLPIELKLDGYNYEFGGVDIPFFVSGYYKPNTHNELQNLRLLFENNLIGIADSTKYIEYPDKKYDDYSVIVQNSLNTLTQTILDIIKNSKTNCNIDLYKNIKIKIIGYADERGFSDFARYSGDEIVDSKIDRKVLSGMKMDNELLGLLRAYNTFKYLENELNKDPLFKENESKVKWDISSGGISTTENEQIRKRKVEIIISTE